MGQRIAHIMLVAGLLFILATGNAFSQIPPQGKAQAKLATTEIRIREFKLICEVARTEKAKADGLMFRKELGINEGMIFVFGTNRRASFWMKNTQLPLSIAYIDSTGTILEIYDLKPFDETPVLSRANNICFALEVNQGWFAVRKIVPGERILGISSLLIPNIVN